MSSIPAGTGISWRRAGVWVFVFALLVRLFYLVESSDNPTFDTPVMDAFNYDQTARMLAGDGQVSTLLFWQPMFYPLVLSGIYRITGSSMLCARLMQVLLGAVTCVLTSRLGRGLLGERTGLLAAGITALYGPLIFFEAELLPTGWTTFWGVALLGLLLRLRNSGGRLLCLAVGLCGGLAALTHPAFIPFLAVAAVWLAIAFRRTGYRPAGIGVRLAVLAAGFLVVVLPAAAFTFAFTRQFTILPANGAVNLYMGNNPDAARTEAIRPWGEYTRLRSLAARSGARRPWEEKRFFNEKVMRYIADEPMDFCAGLGRKAVQFINSREIPSYEDVYLFGRWSWLLRVLAWKAGPFGFPFGLLVPLATVGAIGCRRQVPAPVLLMMCVYGAVIVLVHVMGRYRIPLVPPLAILAAGGCTAILAMYRCRQWRPMVATAVGLIVIVLVCSLPGPFEAERLNTQAELYLGLAIGRMHQGRPDAAAYLCSQALDLDPCRPDAHYQLALAFHSSGKLDQAIRQYTRVIEAEPDYFEAHTGLADALLQQGKIDPAIEHYRRALAINPADVSAAIGLGNALVEQGNVDEGIEHYRRVLDTEPANTRARCNLGTALVRMGRMDEAMTEYHRVLTFEPLNVRAHCLLGAALVNLGRTQEGMAEYRRALEIDPKCIPARQGLESILPQPPGRPN